MKCPKCPGRIVETQTKHGATYGACIFCKGMWISLTNLPKIFKTEKVVEFVTVDFSSKVATAFKCSYCSSSMTSGKVLESNLKLDECEKCQSFFFDVGEMDSLLDIVAKPVLPKAQAVQFDVSKMTKLNSNCPVCKDAPLWTYEGKKEQFKTCLKCHGILTSVEALQNIAHHSLFGPTMFTFRAESGEIRECRYCHEAQSPANTSCQKCGRPVVKVKCASCSGDMGEYVLNGVTIERCQVCNTIWLDEGELEKVMMAMPDFKKRYEAGQRMLELHGTTEAAEVFALGVSIDNSNRKFLDHSPLGRELGPLIYFFYPG